MKRRSTILFLLCTLFLVVFEYIILHEVYSGKRWEWIIAGIAGLIIAFAFFFIFFKKYRKATDES